MVRVVDEPKSAISRVGLLAAIPPNKNPKRLNQWRLKKPARTLYDLTSSLKVSCFGI